MCYMCKFQNKKKELCENIQVHLEKTYKLKEYNRNYTTPLKHQIPFMNMFTSYVFILN